MMTSSLLLWDAVKEPISAVLPPKVRLLGFIGNISAHCPCVLRCRMFSRDVSRRAPETSGYN
jgi:hypothetical protein